MSHPINPRYLAGGKRVADQMMEAAFGRGAVPRPAAEFVGQAEEILIAHQRHKGGCLCGWSELGKSHPGHQVAMLRAAGLFGDVERLTAALAAVEQDRDKLSSELTVVRRERAWLLQLVGYDELQEFRLLAQTADRAREDAKAAPLTDLIGIAPDRVEHGTEAGQ